jgi:hypothetical protein
MRKGYKPVRHPIRYNPENGGAKQVGKAVLKITRECSSPGIVRTRKTKAKGKCDGSEV